MTTTGTDTPSPATARADDHDWRTLTQPDLHFTMQVPVTWHCRTARVKTYRFLGIPFEPAPRWSDMLADGWNRLSVDTGHAAAALQVTLNPERFPGDLADVINDPWARALNLRTVETTADVRLGGLAGFAVLQNLEGVGPKVTLGPVTVSGGTIKARLLQRQIWLRGPELSVHVHYVVPADDAQLRETMERAAETVGLDR